MEKENEKATQSAVDVEEKKRQRREYYREYMRNYRRKRPEIVAAAEIRSLEKKLRKLAEQNGGANDGE